MWEGVRISAANFGLLVRHGVQEALSVCVASSKVLGTDGKTCCEMLTHSRQSYRSGVLLYGSDYWPMTASSSHLHLPTMHAVLQALHSALFDPGTPTSIDHITGPHSPSLVWVCLPFSPDLSDLLDVAHASGKCILT